MPSDAGPWARWYKRGQFISQVKMLEGSASNDEVKKTLPPKQTFLSLSWDYFKLFLTCASIYGVGYFRLSTTWVLVGSLGYFVLQHTRNKQSRLISSLKAIGEDEKAFIIQNFTVRDLPSWVGLTSMKSYNVNYLLRFTFQMLKERNG